MTTTVQLGRDMQATSIPTDHDTVLFELWKDGRKIASYDLTPIAVVHVTSKLAQALTEASVRQMDQAGAV